jgi:hypothetical protein
MEHLLSAEGCLRAEMAEALPEGARAHPELGRLLTGEQVAVLRVLLEALDGGS